MWHREKRREEARLRRLRRKQKRLGKLLRRFGDDWEEEYEDDETEVSEEMGPELGALLEMVQKLLALEAADDRVFPGASHLSLRRPDTIKYQLADFALHRDPGKRKFDALNAAAQLGPVGGLPDLDHWLMEEFIYHGAPGDDFHPIDGFLAREGDRFPPEAREQLRRWKQARLGIFEVGRVRANTVTLTEWDIQRDRPVGPSLSAIALNIGGVETWSRSRREIALSYLAPWSLEPPLYCLMGYSLMLPRKEAWKLLPFLALREPALACRPWPWQGNSVDAQRCRAEWDRRDWRSWLSERLAFPFQAYAWDSSEDEPEGPVMAVGLCPPSGSPESGGLCLELTIGREVLAARAEEVRPLDLLSANAACLAEYRAYLNWLSVRAKRRRP